jgi:hypothetical protein
MESVVGELAPDRGDGVRSGVLRTHDERHLARIALPHVSAVVWTPRRRPAWLGLVAAAVERGELQVPRTVLDDVTIDEIDAWLDATVPVGVLPRAARAALCADVLGLARRLRVQTAASRFMLRVLTAVPSRHCGFHVDTVAPGAPTWGILRVYNGAGTDYIEPDNVTATRDFYRYLGARERLVRRAEEAGATGDGAARDAWLAQVGALDEGLAFLRRRGEIHTAPAGSIVAFKHLDVRLHWSGHQRDLAWIHCSPMRGGPRFLVNVTARPSVRGSSRRSARSGRGATAR